MNYGDFFINRSTNEISRDLLGRTLSFSNGNEILSGIIVGAKAYAGVKDRAAHSYSGRRSRANEGSYRLGGSLYTYSQRQHFFFDAACQAAGEPQGILIRAIDPLTGIDIMIKNRNGETGPLLTNGPGKMMQALGITSRKWNLARLEDSPFGIDINHKRKIEEITVLPRVGINQSGPKRAKKKLRFIVAGSPCVSDIKKKDVKKNHGFIRQKIKNRLVSSSVK